MFNYFSLLSCNLAELLACYFAELLLVCFGRHQRLRVCPLLSGVGGKCIKELSGNWSQDLRILEEY